MHPEPTGLTSEKLWPPPDSHLVPDNKTLSKRKLPDASCLTLWPCRTNREPCYSCYSVDRQNPFERGRDTRNLESQQPHGLEATAADFADRSLIQDGHKEASA